MFPLRPSYIGLSAVLACGLALSAVGACTASAAEPVVVHEGFYPLAGPVLSGDTVVWAQGASGDKTRVRAAVPGAQASTLLTLPFVAFSSDGGFVDLAGSPEALGVRTTTTKFKKRRVHGDDPVFVPFRRPTAKRQRIAVPTKSTDTLLGATPGSTPAPLAAFPYRLPAPKKCSAPLTLDGGFSAAGADLLWSESITPCVAGKLRWGQSSGRIVSQPATGGPVTVLSLQAPGASQVTEVHGEGDFVASELNRVDSPSASIEVRRRSTGELISQVALDEYVPFDVQADGTLAYVATDFAHNDFSYTPTVLLPGQSVGQPLPFEATPESIIRISGGRVAFSVGKRHASLILTDLAGIGSRIGSLGDPVFFTTVFDLSPTRITWLQVKRKGPAPIKAQDL
jgi:hypothetical protein